MGRAEEDSKPHLEIDMDHGSKAFRMRLSEVARGYSRRGMIIDGFENMGWFATSKFRSGESRADGEEGEDAKRRNLSYLRLFHLGMSTPTGKRRRLSRAQVSSESH